MQSPTSPVVDEVNAPARISDANARASGRASLSPLRHRSVARTPSMAEVMRSNAPRRSSLMTESLEDARQSIRSSTDDLLLPRVRNGGFNATNEPSHWHSAPLALALFPAIGGLLFTNGSAVITDVTLLILAAVFLNWSVRLPWDWYCSAQTIRIQEPYTPDDYLPETIIEEESEDEKGDGDNRLAPDSKSSSPPKHRERPSRIQKAAESELRIHELLALFSCFLFPAVGAWLLHTIRSQLSRPSEGLVSDYNLTIFLLGAELRPLSHLIKMVQARTLHLQRTVRSNPFEEEKIDKDKVIDLSKRLDELEAHVAEKSIASQSNGHGVVSSGSQVSSQVRKDLQPELDALNRAVRRYEKRATLLALQTEARLRDLESRMNDAITLAAAAERSHVASRRGYASILLEWICAALVMPVQALYTMLSLPPRTAFKVLGLLEGYVGKQVQVEMRTAGRTSAGYSRGNAASRSQGRGNKKPS